MESVSILTPTKFLYLTIDSFTFYHKKWRINYATKKEVKKSISKKRTTSSFSVFTPKINLLLLFVGLIVLSLIIVASQNTQEIRQRAQETVPSPVCGGSNLCVPSSEPSLSPDQTNPNDPGQIEPDPGGNEDQPNPNDPGQVEPDPGGNEDQPNPNDPGQVEPGQPDDNGGGDNGGNNDGNNGGNQGLLGRIMEMLNQILQMLQQLLGGDNGTPTNPNPNNPTDPNQPNPDQPSAAPSTNPDPNNPADPNNPQPSTANPSDAPSGTAGDTVAPSAPTNLKATSVAGGKINLTWTAATDNTGGSGIKEYEVYRSEGDAKTGGNSGITFKKIVGNATKYTDTGLTAGKIYYYYVRAYDNANNRSEHSNTSGATAKK